jgi:hypothetical protein
VAQTVEYLLCKCKALSSNCSPTKKKKKKKRKKKNKWHNLISSFSVIKEDGKFQFSRRLLASP